MNFFGFKKKQAAPDQPKTAGKMERLHAAMAAGISFEDALRVCDLSPRQYAYSLLQAKPELQALLETGHAKKVSAFLRRR